MRTSFMFWHCDYSWSRLRIFLFIPFQSASVHSPLILGFKPWIWSRKSLKVNNSCIFWKAELNNNRIVVCNPSLPILVCRECTIDSFSVWILLPFTICKQTGGNQVECPRGKAKTQPNNTEHRLEPMHISFGKQNENTNIITFCLLVMHMMLTSCWHCCFWPFILAFRIYECFATALHPRGIRCVVLLISVGVASFL